MRIPLKSLSFLLALTGSRLICAEDAPKPAPGLEGTMMIADLRAELPGVFQYGTWKDQVTTTKSGLAVLGSKGAQGNGGLGREISPAVNLGDVRFVEVALGTVPGNEVPQVTLAFNDADGTQFTARVLVEQLVPGQPVWLRAKREDFTLNPVEKGADSQMNWSQVTRWHLQGDWTTPKPMQVILVALRVRR
ncbi:hypothetical protein ESB00_17740 [Oleiharenicola lentus]|uniref:Uncharacterized protein n=1 Tax=Oleiharenicola lentus TaxID=2508720 RepID=A0A4V1M625_9BACT|nr:hypothetical protein [Oleiharenicola lentus]RXK53536.1 hypothetical protein ESB00_17740 [Oleiharenicola lentus]